jgi:putative peptidoglycan lipid II flippase
MKLLKAMATIASFTILSRIAGMVRDMLTASVLGAGPVADAFFVALKLPNFFRRVAAEGAFSVSFIPLYTKTISEEGDDKAGQFAGEVFSLMTIILSVFTVLVILTMPWVIHLIAPGFGEGTERYDLAVTLTRFSFPYLLLISVTALFGGMLNAHHKFAPFAAAPIVFNLTLIVAMLCLAPMMPTAGHAMAIGITLSGVFQIVLMLLFIRKHKILFHMGRPRLSDKTKKLFKLMGPGVLSAGVFQVNLFVDMMVASLLPAGAISHLYYADRLHQLPLSIAGIAVGTALLPMLSRAIAEKNTTESQSLFNRSLEFCFFVALPATVALLIIPVPMVAALFEHGKFSAVDTQQTAFVLMGYGVGLPAYIASKIFMTAFWANHDTATPVKIAIGVAVGNLMACLLFFPVLGAAGISLATGVMGWVQVFFLWRVLKRQAVFDFDDRLRIVFPKISICSCIMGLVLSVLSYGLQNFFHDALAVKILALLALLGGGAITYALTIHVSGVLKLNDITTYLKRSKG